MKRIVFAAALLLAAAPVHAAGLWNGTTSDLSATVSATAHSYPTLMCAWISLEDSPDDDCVLALSDNESSGSLDSLELRVEGTELKGWAKASGGGSAATQSGLPTSGLVFVAAVFDSTTSRRVKIGTGDWSEASTTSRAPGNFTRVSIGSLHSGGVSASFNGPITSAAVWRGIDADHVDLVVQQLALGLSPSEVWHALPTHYKPLATSSTGGIGASMTATDVLFDSAIRTAYQNQELTFKEFIDLMKKAGYSAGGNSASIVKHERPDQPDVAKLLWPDSGSTPGPLPPHRVVVIDGTGRIQLAAADDGNWIGATSAGSSVLSVLSRYQNVHVRGSNPFWVEIESGTFTPGQSIAYLDDDGKCADSGTVELGIALEESGGLLRILQTQ